MMEDVSLSQHSEAGKLMLKVALADSSRSRSSSGASPSSVQLRAVKERGVSSDGGASVGSRQTSSPRLESPHMRYLRKEMDASLASTSPRTPGGSAITRNDNKAASPRTPISHVPVHVEVPSLSPILLDFPKLPLRPTSLTGGRSPLRSGSNSVSGKSPSSSAARSPSRSGPGSTVRSPLSNVDRKSPPPNENNVVISNAASHSRSLQRIGGDSKNNDLFANGYDSGEESDVDFSVVAKSPRAAGGRKLRDGKGMAVIKEIVNTERSYVNNVNDLLKAFLEPLERYDAKAKGKLFEIPEVAITVSILKQLKTVNRQLLRDLKSEVAASGLHDANIGLIFHSFAPLFNLYGQYASNHHAVNSTFTNLLNTDKSLKQFQSSCWENWGVKHPKSGLLSQSIESCLIMPVQRVPRYELLLKELIKTTSEDHPDMPFLVQALEKVHQSSLYINNTIRERDNQEKLKLLESQFVGKADLVKAGRFLVREGELVKVSRKTHITYHFHLFTDMMLYSEVSPLGLFKVHQTIFLNSCSVKDIVDDEEYGYTNAIEILSATKSFVVYASDAATKALWLDDLVQLTKQQSTDVQAPIFETDDSNTQCTQCSAKFTVFIRRHHCRRCGLLYCNSCSSHERVLPHSKNAPVRVCDTCCNFVDSVMYNHFRLSIDIIKFTNIILKHDPDYSLHCTVECGGAVQGSTRSSGSHNNFTWVDETAQWELTNFEESGLNPLVTFNLWDKPNRFREGHVIGRCSIPFQNLKSRGTNSDVVIQKIAVIDPHGSGVMIGTLDIITRLFASKVIETTRDPVQIITKYTNWLSTAKSPLIAAAIQDAYHRSALRYPGGSGTGNGGNRGLDEEEYECVMAGLDAFDYYLKTEKFKVFCNVGELNRDGITLGVVEEVVVAGDDKGASSVSDVPAELLSLPEPVTSRGIVVRDIIKNEAKYIEMLRSLVEQFLRPLEDVAAGGSLTSRVEGQKETLEKKKKLFSNPFKMKKLVAGSAFGGRSSTTEKVDQEAQQVVTTASMQIFFQSCRQLLTLNSKLLADLIQSAQVKGFDEMSIGQIFMDFSPLFSLYSQYCTVLDDALVKLNSPVFADYFDSLRSKYETPFNAMLDQPLDRILQYHVELKDVLDNTPVEHGDFKKVEIASQRVIDATQKIAATLSKSANTRILFSVSNEILNLDEDLMAAPNRKFMMKGVVTKLGRKRPKNYMLYLFSDVLMFCTVVSESKVRHNRSIRLSEASAMDHPDGLRGFAYCITVCAPGKSVTVAFESIEQKATWHSNLLQALDYSHTQKGMGGESIIKIAPIWQGDEQATSCGICDAKFTLISRRHHCRNCGMLVCSKCSSSKAVLVHVNSTVPVRCCDQCVGGLDPSSFAHKGAMKRMRSRKGSSSWTLDSDKDDDNSSTPSMDFNSFIGDSSVDASFDGSVAEDSTYRSDSDDDDDE